MDIDSIKLPGIIEPKDLCTVHVSPRIRAQKTFQIMFEHLGETPRYVLDEDVREWTYGEE